MRTDSVHLSAFYEVIGIVLERLLARRLDQQRTDVVHRAFVGAEAEILHETRAVAIQIEGRA